MKIQTGVQGPKISGLQPPPPLEHAPRCQDAGGLRARKRAEAPHERTVDPPGGIPGAGGVVGKAEIPGGAARLRTPSLSFV